MLRRLAPYLRRDGVGCSHWIYRPYATGKSKDDVEFMADEDEGDDFLDATPRVDTPSTPRPAPSKSAVETPDRPRLPTSIKVLNRALGRKQAYEIPESELEETFVRGRGPGGQAINKTNSSVSLIHIPTGIRIQSQPTRSREQNRIAARHILREKLEELRIKGLYTPANAPTEVKRDPRPKKALEQELAMSYTKEELRAAKIRARKADRAKKHRQKKRRMEEEEGKDGTAAEDEQQEQS